MAGLDEALERLVTDQEFRSALERDPQSAMAGYDLTEAERAVLAAQLDPGTGVSGRVEQRTSKSGLLAGLMGSGGAGEVGPGDLAAPAQEPEELLLPAVQAAREAGAGGSTGGGAGDLAAPADVAEAEVLLPGVYVQEEMPIPPSNSNAPGVGIAQVQEVSGGEVVANPDFVTADTPGTEAADDLAGAAPEGESDYEIKMEKVLITSHQTGADEGPGDLAAPEATGDAPEIGTNDESSEDGVARYNFTHAWPSRHEEGVEGLAEEAPEAGGGLEYMSEDVPSGAPEATPGPDLAAEAPEDEPAVDTSLDLGEVEGESIEHGAPDAGTEGRAAETQAGESDVAQSVRESGA